MIQVVSADIVDKDDAKLASKRRVIIKREIGPARGHEGRLYLIAVSQSDEQVEGQFLMPEGFPMAREITLQFENRRIKPEGNRFKDEFTAYEPHVYEIASAP